MRSILLASLVGWWDGLTIVHPPLPLPTMTGGPDWRLVPHVGGLPIDCISPERFGPMRPSRTVRDVRVVAALTGENRFDEFHAATRTPLFPLPNLHSRHTGPPPSSPPPSSATRPTTSFLSVVILSLLLRSSSHVAVLAQSTAFTQPSMLRKADRGRTTAVRAQMSPSLSRPPLARRLTGGCLPPPTPSGIGSAWLQP